MGTLLQWHDTTNLVLRPSEALAKGVGFNLNDTPSLGRLALIYIFAGIVSGFGGFGFSAIGALRENLHNPH